jgi:(1->4)-alpha-D-glucan 1-alpha-D-glucosylmutase
MPVQNLNRIPLATYRVQLNREFTFKQAAEIVPYLKQLGISDLYASPIFQASPGSSHGYDVCDFRKLNPELGTTADFEKLHEVLKSHGMGLLVDMVPNHMGAELSNPYWLDVLKYGEESQYADMFDIDWNTGGALLDGKVMLPVLGDDYREVLERGELTLVHEAGEYWVRYFEKKFPVNPSTVEDINLQEAKGADGLDALLNKQHYRLVFWRLANEQINYRRFFDVTSLIALRAEDEKVFRETHRYVFELIEAGTITGLRVDHPDGLRDPKKYFERVQENVRAQGKGLFVVAEKILSGEEKLPGHWPVEGTTGYDFLNALNRVFVQPANEAAVSTVYRDFIGEETSFTQIATGAKALILRTSLRSEFNRLVTRLKSLARRSHLGLEITESELAAALEGVLAHFPVYRTYITEDTRAVSRAEQIAIETAVQQTLATSGFTAEAAVLFIQRILLLDWPDGFSPEMKSEGMEFIQRFQQLSGPATAKGLEDTTFYRYNRLISLNEVGGEPGRFELSPDEFHRFNEYIARHWPHTLLATATHDTKKGEDVRARLNVLSEIPAEWGAAARRWSELNVGFARTTRGRRIPARNDEYLLYQAIIGTWTGGSEINLYTKRIQQFMQKAGREAKQNTTWTDPDEEYEKGVAEFVASVFQSETFRDELMTLLKWIGPFGRINSLAQVLLKTCAPGIPDFYQGTELWDFNLVDPDNRRPVKFEKARELLREIVSVSRTNGQDAVLSKSCSDMDNGALKLFACWTALQTRQRMPELFTFGNYEPVRASGAAAEHVVSFRRSFEARSIVAAVPRWLTSLGKSPAAALEHEDWSSTTLPIPTGKWLNVFTGREFESTGEWSCAGAFHEFPIILLEFLR